MKGYPKYFNTKQDFVNIIRDDMDRAKTKEHLQALLNTAKRKEPVWPDGYDPDNPPEEPVQPVSWEEVDNPGGSIFLMGFTVSEVNGLVEVVDDILPFRDEVDELENSIIKEHYGVAKARRTSLNTKSGKSWLSEAAKTALSDNESLDISLNSENKEEALAAVSDIKLQVQSIIEEKLDIVKT